MFKMAEDAEHYVRRCASYHPAKSQVLPYGLQSPVPVP